MQIQLKPAYIPWLFDSRAAWDAAIADVRFRYDMSFDAFMHLYMEHRANLGPSFARTQTPNVAHAAMAKTATPSAPSFESAPAPVASGGASQLLSQNEIDALINSMNA